MHATTFNQTTDPTSGFMEYRMPMRDTAGMSDATGAALIERPAPRPAERPPISMAAIERVRSTSATQRRIENMQKLIGELANHEMLADEIAWFLKFSPSGARKYIRDLRDAGQLPVILREPPDEMRSVVAADVHTVEG